ncbi:WD40 repeat protein [Nitrospirillum pindoramense]|uniref:WD40 repeat protein n=2 Tax=Nitrospirillum amazonense TaxID=28077 RepID=A0A560HJJ6_9PROT|nr:WD40 repeat protein [Nitrospirillum amazonense]
MSRRRHAAYVAITLGALMASSSPAGADSGTGRVTHWAPSGIASDQYESHPAFDPLTGDLYFVRSTPQFRGWRILYSHCTPSGWSPPQDAPFAGDGVEADPWFSPDGRSVWFISNRTTDGVHREDLDIWRVERGADGHWGQPVRLPSPINSMGYEWFPRLAPDGWLYFGSDRPGGFGKTDIWRARADGQGGWTVENAGPALNGPDDEYEALPSPDGQRLILMAENGAGDVRTLYESHKTDNGWSPRRALGPDVNATGSEIGALFSPTGKTLMFARDLHGNESGEFFVWRGGLSAASTAEEAWPAACPAPQH